MVDNRGGISAEVGESQMWRINQSFLDQQIGQGKTILFASDPYLAKPGTYLSKELQYIAGKGFDVVKAAGGMYRAVK